jgi:predicted DNA-binding ribbon-helix-helix protein
MTEVMEETTVEKLQARLKQEKQWRVNATKVAERRKIQVDKLNAEIDTLNELIQKSYEFIRRNHPNLTSAELLASTELNPVS